MYENAVFIRQQLAHLVEGGLNLQEFMFHCLRNCYGERATTRAVVHVVIVCTLQGSCMCLSSM